MDNIELSSPVIIGDAPSTEPSPSVVPITLPAGIKSWKAIIESCAEPPYSIVEGLIEEGSISLLVGKAKEGKSMLAAQLSIDVANGEPFLGKLKTKQGRVLYIDYENREHRLKDRGLDLAQNHNVQEVYFASYERIFDRDIGLDRVKIQRLEQIVEELMPSLLIIDPLRLSTVEELLDQRRVVDVLTRLSEVFKVNPRLGILLVHHLTKRQSDFSTKLRDDPRAWIEKTYGSQALIAHVETLIGLERDTEGLYTLATVPRSSEPIVWSLEKAAQSERFVLCGDDAQIKMWTHALQEGWKKLPQNFSWSEGTALVGNSTLDRVIRRAKPLGLITQDSATKRYKKAG